MNYYELIEYLDIDSGSEVGYFEEMADIIESDEHIDHEALMRLFSEMEPVTAASLLDEYFSFDPDRITDLTSDKQKVDTRKVIRDKHLYIIKDNETYSVDGKRIR